MAKREGSKNNGAGNTGCILSLIFLLLGLILSENPSDRKIGWTILGAAAFVIFLLSLGEISVVIFQIIIYGIIVIVFIAPIVICVIAGIIKLITRIAAAVAGITKSTAKDNSKNESEYESEYENNNTVKTNSSLAQDKDVQSQMLISRFVTACYVYSLAKSKDVQSQTQINSCKSITNSSVENKAVCEKNGFNGDFESRLNEIKSDRTAAWKMILKEEKNDENIKTVKTDKFEACLEKIRREAEMAEN